MSDGEDTNDFAAFEQKVIESEGKTPEEDISPAVEVEPEPIVEAVEDTASEDDLIEEKPKNHASDRIRELSRKNREGERREADLLARLEALENRLPAEKTTDTSADADKAPDPMDQDKYPLGALDDRYIGDMIEHVANRKVAETLESVRQREAEQVQQAESDRQTAILVQQAEDVASRGAELFDNFEEVVVVPALQGKFDLTQTTFEAIAEVENGARILHALATDTAEAARVAKLTPFQQLKYVSEKDAEFAGGAKPAARRLPGAPVPPSANIRGAGTSSTFDPSTASFAEFEKRANARQ